MHFTDQLQRTIEIKFPPTKIISLVPSITELLCDLGLEEQLIAVTKFCVHPAHIRKSKQIIGGTKNLRIEEIKNLNPDLILANKEENDQTQVEELARLFPVWISDVKTVDDAIQMIEDIGALTNTPARSQKINQDIFLAKSKFQTESPEPSTLYLIWREPYMTVGGDTFISSMLEMAGLNNIMKSRERYPELHSGEMTLLHPDLVFLSSEPYPFSEKHLPELQSIFPQSKISLVDGEMFSWYGSRMLHYFSYIAGLREQLRAPGSAS